MGQRLSSLVKTLQPTIKTGRKWKVVEAVDEAKECLKIKEVIGQSGGQKQKGKRKETWSLMRYGSMKIPVPANSTGTMD